jgi:hypothetical protein
MLMDRSRPELRPGVFRVSRSVTRCGLTLVSPSRRVWGCLSFGGYGNVGHRPPNTTLQQTAGARRLYQVREELFDMRGFELCGMLFVMEQDEASAPVGVGAFGTLGVVEQSAFVAELVEQFRLGCRVRIGVAAGCIGSLGWWQGGRKWGGQGPVRGRGRCRWSWSGGWRWAAKCPLFRISRCLTISVEVWHGSLAVEFWLCLRDGAGSVGFAITVRAAVKSGSGLGVPMPPRTGIYTFVHICRRIVKRKKATGVCRLTRYPTSFAELAPIEQPV